MDINHRAARKGIMRTHVAIRTGAAVNLGDAAPSEDQKINPYAVSLNPDDPESSYYERA